MADTEPPTRIAAWDPTLKPAAVWAELVQRTRTDEQRACVEAATRQADRVWIALHTGRLSDATPVGTIPSRNTSWYRIALSGYEILGESGAYRHLALRRPWACAAAEPVLAAWLQSTTNPESGAFTVAQRLGVGDAVHAINGDTQVAHLSTMLQAAQDAAVFGVPGHRVALALAAETPSEAGTLVRVVVDTPQGPALASQPVALARLVDSDATGVAAATAALRRVADIATNLFTQYAAAVWQSPPPMPVLERSAAYTSQAFTELALSEPSATPEQITPAPSAGPVNPPRTRRPR